MLYGMAVGAVSGYGTEQLIDTIRPTAAEFANMRVNAQACATKLGNQPQELIELPPPCHSYQAEFRKELARTTNASLQTVRVLKYHVPSAQEFMQQKEEQINTRQRDGRRLSPLGGIAVAIGVGLVAYDLSRGSGVPEEDVADVITKTVYVEMQPYTDYVRSESANGGNDFS